MTRVINLLLTALACTVVATTALAGAKRPVEQWSYYHFDGNGFKSGPALADRPFVAVREGVRPVLLTGQASKIEEIDLPEGAGAISGICYIQSSGGKLGSGGGYEACPRTPLDISFGGKPLVTVQTDDQGYFVVVLAAGTYRIGDGPLAAEIPVERGITSLVPLRAGKRMVD